MTDTQLPSKDMTYPGEYPERIYLNRSEDCESENCWELHPETSWCGEKINDGDVEYVRADLARRAHEPRVAQFSKRRPMLEESDAWASAEDERDWWRNYALQIERAATPPRVGINGAGSILGCTCEMCEFHRSAEAIERQRRATSTKGTG